MGSSSLRSVAPYGSDRRECASDRTVMILHLVRLEQAA